MTDFDRTGFNLAAAGNQAGFTAHIAGNWPTRVYELIGATAQVAAGGRDNTSTSTEDIGAGSRTFTLSQTNTYLEGQGVMVVATADTDAWMWGRLASDSSNGEIEIVVELLGSSTGTFASWNVFFGVMIVTQSLSGSPLSIANGGWGATAKATGRANYNVPGAFAVISVLSTPPGSPTDGDRYLIGASPTGAWSGQSNKLADRVSGSWVISQPAEGDFAVDLLLDTVYVYVGGSQFGQGVWVGSGWKEITPKMAKRDFELLEGAFTIDGSYHGKAITVSVGAPFNVTLRDPSTDDGQTYGARVVLEHPAGTGAMTVIMEGGDPAIRRADGTAVSSFVIADGDYYRAELECGNPGSSNFWYETSKIQD